MSLPLTTAHHHHHSSNNNQQQQQPTTTTHLKTGRSVWCCINCIITLFSGATPSGIQPTTEFPFECQTVRQKLITTQQRKEEEEEEEEEEEKKKPSACEEREILSAIQSMKA